MGHPHFVLGMNVTIEIMSPTLCGAIRCVCNTEIWAAKDEAPTFCIGDECEGWKFVNTHGVVRDGVVTEGLTRDGLGRRRKKQLDSAFHWNGGTTRALEKSCGTCPSSRRFL